MFQRLSNLFSTSKYIVFRHKYLIEEKPTRPLSSYNLFVQRWSINHNASTANRFLLKEAAAAWKALPDQEKQKVQQEAKSLSPNHDKLLEAWNDKYKKPFIKRNVQSVIVKQFFAENKGERVGASSKKVVEYKKKIPSQKIAQYEAVVNKINTENQLIKRKLEIPNPVSLITFKRSKSTALTSVEPTSEEQLRKEYKEYCLNVDKEREQFAKGFGITIQELMQLEKKAQRSHIRSLSLRRKEKEQISSPQTASDKTAAPKRVRSSSAASNK